MEWLEKLVDVAHAGLTLPAREALYARGVSDEQIRLYKLGSLHNSLPEGEYPSDFLRWAHQAERIQDVFVLPTTNTRGEVKGLQLRYINRARKGYSNYILDKSEAVLFGLGQAMPSLWKGGFVYLVEGAFDLFPIQRCLPATISTQTAHVAANFNRILRRLVDEIWFGYDRDEAGKTGAQDFAQKHRSEYRSIQIVQYPPVSRLDGKGLIKDPSDLWEAWGDVKLSRFIHDTVRPSTE